MKKDEIPSEEVIEILKGARDLFKKDVRSIAKELHMPVSEARKIFSNPKEDHDDFDNFVKEYIKKVKKDKAKKLQKIKRKLKK